MAGRDRIGNTPTMTTSPPPTRYHRWLGWYAPAMRRAVIVGSVGLAVVVVLVWFLPWGMAVVAGWDAAALTFLVSIWPIIIRADEKRQVLADHQWQMVQQEEGQNEQLPQLSNQILELTKAIHAMNTARSPGGPNGTEQAARSSVYR